MFLYWKTLLHNTFTIPEVIICQHLCSGLQRITFKTENNCLANIDSCQPLEFCLSTGQVIASSLCIHRNQIIRGLSLVISFSCCAPVSDVFLFIAKFKVHLQWLVLLAPWTVNVELRPSGQTSLEGEAYCGNGDQWSPNFFDCIPLSVRKI